jgi:hypothetical protein
MAFTEDRFWIIRDMEKGSSYGLMDSITTENGWTMKNMEVEFGHHHIHKYIQIHILESGKKAKWMDMECILGVSFLSFRSWS